MNPKTIDNIEGKLKVLFCNSVKDGDTESVVTTRCVVASNEKNFIKFN